MALIVLLAASCRAVPEAREKGGFRRENGGFVAHRERYRVEASQNGFRLGPSIGERLGAPMTFDRLEIRRDGRSLLENKAPELAIGRAGELVLAFGHVIETLQSGPEGLELSWTFDHYPSGRGDLVVELAAGGLRLTGETSSGLRFADARGSGVLFGESTWVDARGVRTPLRARYSASGGVVELRVPGEVLDASAFPAVLDPTVSPEFGVDAPVSQRGLSHLRRPAAAYCAGMYLVAFDADATDLAPSSHRFVRIRASDGAVLDEMGIVYTDDIATGDDRGAAVACDGTNFIIAYGAFGGIRALRIRASDGVVLDNPPITVSRTVVCYSPAVIFTPAATRSSTASFFVSWHSRAPIGLPSSINGARIRTRDGFVLDNIEIASAQDLRLNTSVAFDGTNVLVAWEDWRNPDLQNHPQADIYAARVRASDGALLDGPVANGGIPISTEPHAQSAPSVTFDGTNFLIAWLDARVGARNAIFGARLAPGGSLIDGPPESGGLNLGSGAPLNPGLYGWAAPGVTSDGARDLVFWRDGGGMVHGQRIRPADGTTLDGPDGVLIPHGGTVPVFDGTNVFVAGLGYGTRIRPSDLMSLDAGGIQFATTANYETNPAVAHGMTTYLVAWGDNRGDQGGVFGARVRASDGALLDPTGLLIATSPTTPLRYVQPAIAFDGTNYFVTGWGGATRISESTGARLDGPPSSTGIPVSCQVACRVAYLAGTYLVVWNRGTEIRGMRVRASDGALLDGASADGFRVTGGARYDIPLSVTAGNSEFLVLHAPYPSGSRDLHATFVRQRDAMIGPELALAPGAFYDEFGEASGAFDGTNFLATWSSGRFGLNALRITEAGMPLDGPPWIHVASMGRVKVSTIFDGINFLVAASGRGFRIRPRDGALLDGPPETAGFPIGASHEAVATEGNGRSLVAYQRFILESPFNAVRVRARFVSEPDGGLGTDGGIGLDSSRADIAVGEDSGVPESGDATGDATAGGDQHADASPGLDAIRADASRGSMMGGETGCGCRISGQARPTLEPAMLVLGFLFVRLRSRARSRSCAR